MLEPAAIRRRAIQRVLVIELLLNVAVALAKAVYGYISGSLVIITDSIHSLVDGANNIIGMFIVGWSSAPPDPEHPYGHRKLEVLAALGIAVLIGATALSFGRDAAEALIAGREPPTTSLTGFIVIGGTMVVNLFVAWYEARKAKELQSNFLAADAAHTASDVLVTAAVLLSFGASHLGVVWADPVGALIVLFVIGRVAYGIVVGNVGVLLDQAVVDADEVRQIANAHPDVAGCHRIRSRGPSDAILVDLHLVISGEVTLARAHAIAHEVEDAIRGAVVGVVDVIVHAEPEGEAEEPL